MTTIRLWLIRVLLALVRWLELPVPHTPGSFGEALTAPTPFEQDITAWVADAETLDAHGEYKEHVIFARALKAHPAVSPADVKWAIQKAYRRMRGLALD